VGFGQMLAVASEQMVASVRTGAGFGLVMALELVHCLCWQWNRHADAGFCARFRCWL
jgi:hypothetical protein